VTECIATVTTMRSGADTAVADAGTRQVGPLVCAGLGAVAALLALVPWLLTGMRLPLQNLWAEQTLPADMPVALLPLSQYAITDVLALVVMGYGAAGAGVRALQRAPSVRLPSKAALYAGAGTLVVHLVVALQSLTVVASGLSVRTASMVYVAALAALVATAVLAGWVVLVLVTVRSRAVAVIGLTLMAVLAGPWLTALLAPTGTAPGPVAAEALTSVVRWVPAVLVGVAVAWGGLRGHIRILAGLAAVLVLWVVPAALTALSSAAGYRVAFGRPAELAGFAGQVLRAALLQVDSVVPPLLLAVAVAVGGIAMVQLLGRPRAREAISAPSR
jgi:hypothetical protein